MLLSVPPNIASEHGKIDAHFFYFHILQTVKMLVCVNVAPHPIEWLFFQPMYTSIFFCTDNRFDCECSNCSKGTYLYIGIGAAGTTKYEISFEIHNIGWFI